MSDISDEKLLQKGLDNYKTDTVVKLQSTIRLIIKLKRMDIKIKESKNNLKQSIENYINNKTKLIIKKGCRAPDCLVKRPCFNYLGQTNGIYCKDHKKENMINVRDKKCKCKKSIPSFGYEGGKSICCKDCKTPDMISTHNKNKLCKCKKHQARFGFTNDEKATRCSECKEEKMIDIISRLYFCVEHKTCFNF